MNETDMNRLHSEILFPFEKIRQEQDKLIKSIAYAISQKKHLLVHAPTGLGKTIASLGPALKYAIDNNKTIFFLTSRHTQHIMAVDTLREIKKRFDVEFSSTDIIGKKHMCIFPAIDKLPSGEFADYCRHLREDDKCEFYSNFKKGAKVTAKAISVIEGLGQTINHTEDVIETCTTEKLCPYEVSAYLGRNAKVIITDYYYIFNAAIRESFFRRIEKKLEDCIIIVDEAHNLPERLRSLFTVHLSSFMVKRAIIEAKKFHMETVIPSLAGVQEALNSLSANISRQRLVRKEEFINIVKRSSEYDLVIKELAAASELIKNKQRFSYISGIIKFLEAWLGEDDGFARIISLDQYLNEPYVKLEYKCLDPSLATKEIVQECHSVICMSGTLAPVEMYADLLGFDARSNSIEFKSPFPARNVLRIVVPGVTTKFTKRSHEEYSKIAQACSLAIDAIPGNCAIFFPSYSIRNSVARFLDGKCSKRMLLEDPKMNKEQRAQLLARFKDASNIGNGAVLLAAASGSFGEGIDMPGDFLKGVIVVGLPLGPPDIETRAIIDYYDRKFGKGWDYGYVFPAMTKCIQSAGRCIRSETDRGVIVFLDERFAWPQYSRCFPSDYEIDVSEDFAGEIKQFFRKK